MTLARRQVLGWGALGIGAFALDGCGAGFPWSKTATEPADVEPLLRELDQVVVRLESLEPDMQKFGIKSHGPELERGRDACIRLLTTLCFLGTYRHVPESLWSDPRIEARLAKTLPRINSVLKAARDELVKIGPEEAARVDERLQQRSRSHDAHHGARR